MKWFAIALAGVLAAWSLSGQTPKRKPAPDPSILQTQIGILFERTSAIKTSVSLDPAAQPKFQRIDSDLGTLLLIFEKAEPYLDGYKARGQFGNPSTARINAYAFDAKWGPEQPDFTKRFSDWAQWNAALKAQRFDLTTTLRPGAWNSVELVLPACKDGFRYLKISNVEIQSLSLSE